MFDELLRLSLTQSRRFCCSKNLNTRTSRFVRGPGMFCAIFVRKNACVLVNNTASRDCSSQAQNHLCVRYDRQVLYWNRGFHVCKWADGIRPRFVQSHQLQGQQQQRHIACLACSRISHKLAPQWCGKRQNQATDSGVHPGHPLLKQPAILI